MFRKAISLAVLVAVITLMFGATDAEACFRRNRCRSRGGCQTSNCNPGGCASTNACGEQLATSTSRATERDATVMPTGSTVPQPAGRQPTLAPRY